MASEVGAKSEAVSQPREQSSLLVEQKHVTSWADEVEEADDGSVQIIPALLSQHQQPAPALQQKYTAIWGDRPPFSVCINNLPAGMPFEDIAALFRGAYILSIKHRPTAEAPYVFVEFNDQRDALAALASGQEQRLVLQGRKLSTEPVPFQPAGTRPGYLEPPTPNGIPHPSHYQQPQQQRQWQDTRPGYSRDGPYSLGPPPRGSSSSFSRPGGLERPSGSGFYGSSHTSPERWRPGSAASSSVGVPAAAAAAASDVAGSGPGTPSAAPAARPVKRSDPFGGAKPVDTAAVYMDGHPHHADVATARMGPTAAAAAAGPAIIYSAAEQQQQQQPPPIKLLQRPPQPLQQQDSPPEPAAAEAARESASHPIRSAAEQQQQQLLPPIPRQQQPSAAHLAHLMQQQQQQQRGSPYGSPSIAALAADPVDHSAPIVGSSSSSNSGVPGAWQTPNPHYSAMPPPPPPPPRTAAGVAVQDSLQPAATTAAPIPAGAWASGVLAAAAAGPPPPPHTGTQAAAAPSLQGAWAVRGSTGAPVIGYKALGSSRPGSSSGPISGPGSGPSSQRGSYTALADGTAQDLDPQQQQQHEQQQSRFYGQQQQQQDVGHLAALPPQQPVAAAPAAAADDWGVVEEFISQQQRDYSILQPEQELLLQRPEPDQVEEQEQQQQQQEYTEQEADGTWGTGTSASPAAAPPPEQQQQHSPGWSTAVAAADQLHEGSTGPADQLNPDSWGSKASDSAATREEDGAKDSAAAAAAEGDSSVAAKIDAADSSDPSGRGSRGRGRVPRGRGRSDRGFSGAYAGHSMEHDPGFYGGYRGRGVPRGYDRGFEGHSHPAAAGPRGNEQQQYMMSGRGRGGRFIGAQGLGVPGPDGAGKWGRRGATLVHDQQQRLDVEANGATQQQRGPVVPPPPPPPPPAAPTASGRDPKAAAAPPAATAAPPAAAAAATTSGRPLLRRSSSNMSAGRGSGRGDRLQRRSSNQDVTTEWVPKGSVSAAATPAAAVRAPPPPPPPPAAAAAVERQDSIGVKPPIDLQISHSGIDPQEAANAVAAARAAVADILSPASRTRSIGNLTAKGRGAQAPAAAVSGPAAAANGPTAATNGPTAAANGPAAAEGATADDKQQQQEEEHREDGVKESHKQKGSTELQHASSNNGSSGLRSRGGPLDRGGGRARGRGSNSRYSDPQAANGAAAAADGDTAAARNGGPYSGSSSSYYHQHEYPSTYRGRGRSRGGPRGRGRDSGAYNYAGSYTISDRPGFNRDVDHADGASEATESDEVSVTVRPRSQSESGAAANGPSAAAAGGRAPGKGRGRGGRFAPDRRTSADGHAAAAGDNQQQQHEGGRGRGRGRARGEGRGRGGRGDVAVSATAADQGPDVAAANSKPARDKPAAAAMPAKQPLQQQQLNRAVSAGQKLFKEITAKQKEVTKGAKLDNPFALLELDAE